jgi:hypothetical protein
MIDPKVMQELVPITIIGNTLCGPDFFDVSGIYFTISLS